MRNLNGWRIAWGVAAGFSLACIVAGLACAVAGNLTAAWAALSGAAAGFAAFAFLGFWLLGTDRFWQAGQSAPGDPLEEIYRMPALVPDHEQGPDEW